MVRPQECPLNTRCKVHLMWKKAQEDLDALLKGTTLDQGTHAVPWDASGHPAGVYLVRLKTAAGSVSRKLTLVP